MPVKKEASGRRSVEAEVEVPGTPEQVWNAIATGPGITSWFVPSKVEERVGGAVTCSFGPGMDSVSKVTVWEPPRRFVAESRDDLGPGDPTVATEWIVETRAGGNCVVRVVHSWFTDKDDWDNQFEGHTHGWRSFFRVLRLYQAHFAGQRGAMMQVMAMQPEPKPAAWDAVMKRLGMTAPLPGKRLSGAADAPGFRGVVEYAGQPAWPEELLLRTDEPTPGIAHFVAHPMGGQVFVSLRFYLYGDGAAAAVARAEPLWQAWVAKNFPPPSEAPSVSA